MPDQVNLKGLLDLGLGSEQAVKLLEPLHADEASQANLQCNGGAVGVRTSIAGGLTPLDLPLGSVGDQMSTALGDCVHQGVEDDD